jgi:biotin operon repressor
MSNPNRLDVISARKAREDIGISRSEMDEIVREMRQAGYTVVKDGRITWLKPSEIEQYLLMERSESRR